VKQKYVVLLVFAALFLAGVSAQVLALYPDGIDNYTIIASEKRGPKAGLPITAEAGNVTWLAITHLQKTRRWQGFVGNITGEIVLDDASNDTFYAWNLSNISGHIYASRNCSINWNLISTQNDCTVDEVLTGPGSDSVRRTYQPSSNTNTYQIMGLTVSPNTVCTAYPYVNDSKQTTTTLFENIILTTGSTPNGNNSIYVGWLENQVSGFEEGEYNFQLLVPVNRTSGFSTYCLYAELD